MIKNLFFFCVPAFLRDLFYCDLVFSFLSSCLKILYILLANGASSASEEEVEAKKAQLKKEIQEFNENCWERKLENEQYSREGENDDPNEENTGKDLKAWDGLINKNMKVIEEIINWLAN